MGQNVDKLMKAKAEARLAEYAEFRPSLDNAKVGLALTAIRQRIENDLGITVAAYELDLEIDNASFRVHRDPADGLNDVMALVARLEACDTLIEKYQAEIQAKIQEQWAAEVTDEQADQPQITGWEDAVVDLCEAAEYVDEGEPEASGDE